MCCLTYVGSTLIFYRIGGGIVIEFRNVVKVYDKNSRALNTLNFNIPEGQFVFIVGASGSGKSTMLKLLTKEEEPTSGSIIVNGVNLSSIKRRKIPYYRRGLGIVFQDFRLLEGVSVFDNVAFALHVTGAGSSEIKKRVDYILNLVELSDRSKSKVSELSGGEKQRVGLARALVNNPKILIADEPTGNIDPHMSLEIVNLLSQINKCGTTVIMVTHDITLVKMFNFRVVELSKGRVINDTELGGDG